MLILFGSPSYHSTSTTAFLFQQWRQEGVVLFSSVHKRAPTIQPGTATITQCRQMQDRKCVHHGSAFRKNLDKHAGTTDLCGASRQKSLERSMCARPHVQQT